MAETPTEKRVRWPSDVLGRPETASIDIMATCRVVVDTAILDIARTSCVSEKVPAPQGLLVARNRNATA